LKLQTPSPEAQFAAELRGFGPVGIFAILIVLFSGNVELPNIIMLPIGAFMVLLWVHLSHTPWSSIGYKKPSSWVATIIIGTIFGIIFKLVMKAVVMPVFPADPINHTYHFLVGNKSLLPAASLAMITAGFGEETVFRGYMFERLGKLFGEGRIAKTWIIIITSMLFGMSHLYDQGMAGAEQATITGLAFGMIFAATGNIWMVMIAHASFDLTALAIIYSGLEERVGHFIFN
jgi:membrane protease YdiL (CAAX protease family)